MLDSGGCETKRKKKLPTEVLTKDLFTCKQWTLSTLTSQNKMAVLVWKFCMSDHWGKILSDNISMKEEIKSSNSQVWLYESNMQDDFSKLR